MKTVSIALLMLQSLTVASTCQAHVLNIKSQIDLFSSGNESITLLAQAETGSGGCYFGECDTAPSQPSRPSTPTPTYPPNPPPIYTPPPVVQTPIYTPPPPQPAVGRLCRTPVISCVVPNFDYMGRPCGCFYGNALYNGQIGG